MGIYMIGGIENEMENGMIESVSEVGDFFDKIALVAIDIVLIIIIYKTFTRDSACSFNTDNPTLMRKKVSDVKAWNRAHAIGYTIYAVALNIVFIYPLLGFGFDGYLIDGLIFFGTLILGFLGLLINHTRLMKKYLVDREEYSDYN